MDGAYSIMMVLYFNLFIIILGLVVSIYQFRKKRKDKEEKNKINFYKTAHQKIGLIEKISPIKLYTKVKKSIEKNTNIRYNLIDEN